jgi:hypothetical protein
MSSSFCKECREKCKFFDSDSDSEDYSSDTSSEYYRDSSDESSELPIDLSELSISDNSTDGSTDESSDLPIDMSKLSMSEESEESEDSEDSEDSDKRKRKRGSTVSESSDYTSDLSDYTNSSGDYTSDFDLNKLSLKETEEPEELEQADENEDKLSQLLTAMFVSKKEPTEDNLDYLTSNLSRLRVSPKKKRKSTNKSMDIDDEDIPIKQRLRKSIKKPMFSGKSKIIPRETWTSKSES